MQPLLEPVRDHLTADQVRYLIQNAPARQRRAGIELVDLSLNKVEDFSDDLAGGRIERNSYAILHATATFEIRRLLPWGSALVRPYLILSAGALEARFNLGVYHTSTPATRLREGAGRFDVEGYDILLRLNQSVGDAYSISAGDSYLQKVEDILQSVGYEQFLIDQSAAATVAPSARAWAFDARVTWLTVVNDLLGAVGYAGIWSDWDGRLRCEPYQLPIARSVEWVYSDDAATTMLSTRGTVEHDYFDRANKWVFYRTNMDDGVTPVEGNGKYTFVNQTVGETSVDARDGLVVTAEPVGVDAAGQAELVARAQQTIDADMQVPTTLAYPTSLNPLHWHFDRLLLDDLAAGPITDVMCTQWALPLPPDLGDMEQQWKALFQ